MSLRQLAENDLSFILEDGVYGFGWPITLINPDQATQDLIGFSNDIEQLIDPDTGMAISGRVASIALRMSTLTIGLPVNITDTGLKPWVVIFNDILGKPYKFKVQQSFPDRGLGIITAQLETYKDAA